MFLNSVIKFIFLKRRVYKDFSLFRCLDKRICIENLNFPSSSSSLLIISIHFQTLFWRHTNDIVKATDIYFLFQWRDGEQLDVISLTHMLTATHIHGLQESIVIFIFYHVYPQLPSLPAHHQEARKVLHLPLQHHALPFPNL